MIKLIYKILTMIDKIRVKKIEININLLNNNNNMKQETISVLVWPSNGTIKI